MAFNRQPPSTPTAVGGVAGGSRHAGFQHLAPGRPRKIVLVSAKSERAIDQRIDHSDRVPGVGKMLNALVFAASARVAGEALSL